MQVLSRISVLFAAVILLGIGGCAALPDPLNVSVAGVESLPGEGLELRMLVKLRVQNPNDREIAYTGTAVRLDVLGKAFASGVSGEGGTLPRFGETVVAVPVTVSVLRMVRQVMGMVDGKPIDTVTYSMSGKLQTGAMSSARFSGKGEFNLPKGSTP